MTQVIYSDDFSRRVARVASHSLAYFERHNAEKLRGLNITEVRHHLLHHAFMPKVAVKMMRRFKQRDITVEGW